MIKAMILTILYSFLLHHLPDVTTDISKQKNTSPIRCGAFFCVMPKKTLLTRQMEWII